MTVATGLMLYRKEHPLPDELVQPHDDSAAWEGNVVLMTPSLLISHRCHCCSLGLEGKNTRFCFC